MHCNFIYRVWFIFMGALSFSEQKQESMGKAEGRWGRDWEERNEGKLFEL